MLGLIENKLYLVAREILTGKSFLERMKPVSRNNIRTFVSSCALRFNLGSPIVDVCCGYRTNQPEAMKTHNGDNDPLYIAFDQRLFLDKTTSPFSSANLQANAENIPLPTASCKTVVCTEALEHVANDGRVFREISRILKPGGRLLLTLPGLGVPIHEKLPYQRDYRRYTPQQVKEMLEEESYGDIEIEDRYFERKQINILVTAIKI